MGIGNIGWSGLILILVALLLVFGPSKLPDIGKAFGKSLREFRSATKGIIEDDQDNSKPAPTIQTAAAATVHTAAHVEPIELEPEHKPEQA